MANLRIRPQAHVNFYDPKNPNHQDWLLAVLQRLEHYEPDALQEGGELRAIWTRQHLVGPPVEEWVLLAEEFLRDGEAFREWAYPDPLSPTGDPWTIGYGFTFHQDGSPVKRGDRMPRAYAEAYLRHLVTTFGAEVARQITVWPRLAPCSKAALVSFAYNVGTGEDGLAGSTLRRRLNAGEDPVRVVREEIPRWAVGEDGDDSNGNKAAGLINRRAEEVELFVGQWKPSA